MGCQKAEAAKDVGLGRNDQTRVKGPVRKAFLFPTGLWYADPRAKSVHFSTVRNFCMTPMGVYYPGWEATRKPRGEGSGFWSASARRGSRENWRWSDQFQLIQGRQDLLPARSVLLGFKRKRQVGIEAQDIVAQIRRGQIKLALR